MLLATKKHTFLTGLAAIGIFILLILMHEKNLVCGVSWSCFDYMLNIGYGFLGFAVMVIVPSLICLLFTSLLFDQWVRLARWAVPLIALLTTFLLSVDVGSGIGGLIGGQMILYTLVAVYVLYFALSFFLLFRGFQINKKRSVKSVM